MVATPAQDYTVAGTVQHKVSSVSKRATPLWRHIQPTNIIIIQQPRGFLCLLFPVISFQIGTMKRWLHFSGHNSHRDMVKDYLHLSWIILVLTLFAWEIVERIQKDENLKSKPQVRTTSNRTQHNVELFLSSKTGHSLERNVKLSRRELNDDHHHHLTMPLLEGMWVFLDILVSASPSGYF